MAYLYTNQEYWEMVRVYALADNCITKAVQLYREKFPNRKVPSPRTMYLVNHQLRESGSFRTPAGHTQVKGRESLSERKQEKILEYFAKNPNASSMTGAKLFKTSKNVILNILHKDASNPYHYMKDRPKLGDRNKHTRRVYCRWYLKNKEKHILFTASTNISRLLNTEDDDDEEDAISVDVWAGILGNRLLGPYFIKSLDDDSCVETIEKVVNNMVEDVPLVYQDTFLYQVEGVPAKYQSEVRAYFNTHFVKRWIGRGGTVPWPVGSHDFNPVKYYLWDEVERLVAPKYDDKKELKMGIVSAFSKIRSDSFVLDNLKENLRKRAELCLTLEGEQIEHLLRFV